METRPGMTIDELIEKLVIGGIQKLDILPVSEQIETCSIEYMAGGQCVEQKWFHLSSSSVVLDAR